MIVKLLPLLESNLFDEVKARGSVRKTITKIKTSNVITFSTERRQEIYEESVIMQKRVIDPALVQKVERRAGCTL